MGSYRRGLHCDDAANRVSDEEGGFADNLLAEVDDLLAPGFEGVVDGAARGRFCGLTIANEVNGIDAVGLAEVG